MAVYSYSRVMDLKVTITLLEMLSQLKIFTRELARMRTRELACKNERTGPQEQEWGRGPHGELARTAGQLKCNERTRPASQGQVRGVWLHMAVYS